MKKQAGQSLTENTLILAVVTIAAIGGLGMLGNTLSDQFSGMINKNNNAPVTGGSGQGQVVLQNSPVVNGGLTPTPGSYNLQITLRNGQVMSIPNYPGDLAATIETSGANGTTEKLAQTLRVMADQLLQSGEISQQQADILKNLSNSGFKAADMQTTLADLLNNGMSGNSPPTLLDLVSGSDFALPNADLQVWMVEAGVDGGVNGISLNTIERFMTYSKSDAAQYYQQYGQPFPNDLKHIYLNALGSGAMDNPAVKTVVDDMVKKIVTSAASTNTLMWDLRYEGLSPDLKNNPNALNQAMSENVQKASLGSGVICETGQNTVEGLHCS